ncbi:type IX secretion system membrane protein, PorP/SprF family [Filimonas lacunae]|uniref:Type IX secretion system membrane protein, PorP/SprF family n=1 Tax=Filimonas lacunae TaxID=477680 RepID=A0A173MLR7_9BACT|nr:PorP/SprF family type IX secretion system membrane protein [Filimonas lacunae]BAV08409.1 hypothetical protein FLA_4445 [Filimonas lacunae]SIT33527.1 type IX secretion system membrane protein, PorP/SprF family [Filimonas lacunae]
MKKIVTVLFTVFMIGYTGALNAQVDPHFSQYYVYPMQLNPALTGTMNGDYRVTAIYRNQWNNITNAFSTAGVSADFATKKNINFGVNILRQTAGDGGYTYTNGMASVSYTGIKFGAAGNHRISLALQGGFIGRRFDVTKFKGGEQWVPLIGYTSTLPLNEMLSKTSATVFDAGAGIAYYDASVDKKVNFFAGFSASHLTRPEEPFLQGGNKMTLPVRYSLHAGARIYVSEGTYFVPNALYTIQGNASEKMVGGYMQLAANEVTDFMFGVNYRFKDAIAPYVGLVYNNLAIGASYDINMSQLGKMARGSNSFEISLTLLGKKTETVDYFKCPRF